MPVQMLSQETIIGTFPLLEELLRDMKHQQPHLFIELDWNSLSSIKYWSLDFIREFFEYFNVNVLLTCQSFSEEFLTEIVLITDYNVNVIKTIYCIYNPTIEFKRRFILTCNVDKIVKIKKSYKINKSFENIINYIQDNDIKEYNRLDLKAISSFKLLSQDFVSRHFENLDINILFNNHKFSN